MLLFIVGIRGMCGIVAPLNILVEEEAKHKVNSCLKILIHTTLFIHRILSSLSTL